MTRVIDNGLLQVEIVRGGTAGAPHFALGAVRMRTAAGWKPLLHRLSGAEFVTSLGAAAGTGGPARRDRWTPVWPPETVWPPSSTGWQTVPDPWMREGC